MKSIRMKEAAIKRATLKRCILLIIMLLMTAVFLSGCKSGQELSDKFDQAIVKEKTEAAIKLMENGEIETLVNDWVRDDVKDILTVEVIENAIVQLMPDPGAFVEYESGFAIGSRDNEQNDVAIAVIAVAYENQSVQYTITFDTDMKIIGLYIK